LGGQGTGGYIALHAISLDKASELSLTKFISGVTEPTYDFVAGQPFINQAQMGDFEGYGGDPAKNYANNSPGYSSAVRFVFNLSGALGDSTFLEPGDVPTVSFHVLGDPSAPFWDGMVYVPGNPPQPVVDVAGSGLVSYYANMYGNNSSYAASSSSFTDPYTLAANAVNNGQEGLFPFVTIPALQSGPWEWWDSTAVTNLCLALGTAGDQDETGNVYNPNMSKQKAMAYIDTIMGYLCPRMLSCVTVGLPEHNAIDAGILIAPNPTVDQVQVVLNTDGVQLKKIILTDITGRTIREQETGIDRYSVLNLHGEKNGIYMLQIETNAGVFHRKILKQ
jgi:hypothetical protein